MHLFISGDHISSHPGPITGVSPLILVCLFFFPSICAAGCKAGREMELVFIFLFLCVIIFLFLHSNNFECSFVLNFHIRVIISYCWKGDFRKLLCIDYGLKLPG